MSTASVPIQVPRSGFGAPVNVDNLVGEKTVTLSGRYSGAYVLYGSHDGVRFAPLLIFNAGGIESIRQTFKGAFSQLKIKSLASGAAGVVANVSGLSVPGDNSFTSLGVGIVLDLGDDLYQVDLNFMGFGRVNGAVVVEGSLDGNGFNPIGEFASSQAGASLLGIGAIEFSPIATPDRVRYVRLNVQGSAAPGFLVTVGGAQSEAGGTGGSETLAVAYAVGASAFDQTMVVLASKGGKVVFDGTGLLSPTDETAEILGNWVVGPLTIGPYNVGIGQSGHPTINHNPAAINSVIIGADASISGGYSVVVGSGSVSLGGSDVCIGNQATDQDGQGNKVIIGTCTGAGGGSIAIGTTCHADNHGIAVGINSESIDGYGYGAGIAIGSGASATSVSIAMGDGATASHGGYANIVIGLNAVTDGYGCCVMGANSSTGTQVNNGIAVGLGAQSIDWNTTAIGTGAIAGSASDQSTVDAVAIGHVASALSMSAIAMGPHSTAEGDSTICIGSLASGGDSTSFDDISIGRKAVTTNPGDAWGSSNVAIGSPSYTAITNGSVALGSGANAQGFDHVTHLDVGLIAIGYGADVISMGASIGIGNGVVVHNTSVFPPSTNEPSIGIGDGASVSGAGGAVVVGPSSSTFSNRTVVVGLGASAFGDGSISLGYASMAGDIDEAPNAIAIGATSTAYEDSDIVIGNGAHTDDTNPSNDHNIAMGNGAFVLGGASSIALGDGAQVTGADGVALGSSSSVTGSNGIAIGQAATAGAGQIVFSSGFSGGAQLFKVVGSTPGNPDLFNFAVANLMGADTTALTLLIKKSDGSTIVSVPVTIGLNNSAGIGYAVLRVANT